MSSISLLGNKCVLACPKDGRLTTETDVKSEHTLTVSSYCTLAAGMVHVCQTGQLLRTGLSVILCNHCAHPLCCLSDAGGGAGRQAA